jgi:predicted dienelactone hydrolase
MSQVKEIQRDAIGVTTLHFYDVARQRPVWVELWYPAASVDNLDHSDDPMYVHPHEARGAPLAHLNKPCPLIVMSHGHQGSRRDRSWLADLLVKDGYIVASVEHFGGSGSTYNPLLNLRFWDRPKDITFAIDHLLQDPNWGDQIDLEKVGFIGYSLGGMTGLSLAGAVAKNAKELAIRECQERLKIDPKVLQQVDFHESELDYSDRRIRSMVLICPALFAFPPESLRKIKVPIGLIATVGDEVLPHKEHAYFLIQNSGIKRLKVMRKEISHHSFTNRLTEVGKQMVKAFHRESPCCPREKVHREAGAFITEFFKETLLIYPEGLKN